MQDSTYLLALALTEAALLEHGDEIGAIARTIREDGIAEEVVQALVLILASTLENARGSVGLAIEVIDRWRHSVLANEHRDYSC